MRYPSAMAAVASLILMGTGGLAFEDPGSGHQARQTRSRMGADSGQVGRERLRYLALARRYCTETSGDVIDELSTWNVGSFADVHQHMKHDLEWQAPEVECAAMLHTEVVLRESGWSPARLAHLRSARRLLWLLDGEPLDQSFRRDWYVAMAAFLHGTLRFDEWEAHLKDALLAFPDDGHLLLALGMEHEAQAAPVPRAHLFDQALRMKASGEVHVLREDLPSVDKALLRAEESYRRALGRVPDLHEARLRLGRVLVVRGRPDDGLKELAAVLAGTADARLMYLAALIAGRVYEGRSQFPEASALYRTASSLYPTCQTAWLALSHMARSLGDQAEAERLVRRAIELRTGDCDDPRWIYDLGLAPQADTMFDRLRSRIRLQ